MPIFRPLEGCRFAVSTPGSDSALAPVGASLFRQANALGLRCETTQDTASDEALSFTIETPGGPKVISTISGWPDTPNGPLSEHLVQAACGLMSVHGRASGRTQPLGVDYITTLAAVLALEGACASLIGQFRGMTLARSDTSLLAAGLLAIGQYAAAATAPEAPENLLPGSTSNLDRPPFLSADGVLFELEALDVGPWKTFWASVGIAADVAGKAWSAFLLRYARAIAPLPSELMTAISAMPYARIAALCAKTGMSLCPIRTLANRACDEDAKSTWRRGPWSFDPSDKHPRCIPNQAPGAERPLAGMKIVESCRRIQGPLAGHLLALLGADVLRIEPPGGDPLRAMPPIVENVSARYDALNRLKSVREIDIKSREGQASIKELARDADVFLQNWAPGKAAELSLDHADLASNNPALIYAYAGGWENGVMAGAPGTDFMAQAYSGVASKIGASSGTRGGSLFTVLDVLGGAISAQGVTIALLSRILHHRPTRVETTLLSAATLLCADELGTMLHPKEAAPAVPQGAASTIKGIYPTRQDSIAIECTPLAASRLLENLDPRAEPPATSDIAEILRPLFLAKSAAEWMPMLAKYEIPAVILIEDLCRLDEDARIASCLDQGSYTRIKSPWRFA
jgi:crotonobetainyl-CoA:carnitine CoA-transferase CaiB-like acyl-CoA transferase